MSQIIDRRLNGKHKSAVNRQRFIRRYKAHIKKAVSDAINKRSITEIDKGEKISIPSKDIAEPQFQTDNGGSRTRILPGNKEFVTGDIIPRPPQENAGQGSNQASNQGEGEDDFVFELSREEFLELYFEDLALPDLVKKQLKMLDEEKLVRAGFTTSGVPNNINIIRTMKQATGRRVSIKGPYYKKMKALEEKLALFLQKTDAEDPIVKELIEKISILKYKVKKIPFIDPVDLRYNNKVIQKRPCSQAVMFCIMDVSGSMDELKKEIAKRFFILLYLFLKRAYKKIEIVFIRHHTSAKEVDEEEFFYSRETGGTVVSSALELMKEIIEKRYAKESWNIYAAQASDGDNWNADSPYCHDLIANYIMQHVQYYAYVEIMPRHHQSLWEVYSKIKEKNPHFSMQNIDNINEIYPVFRELFKRQKK